MSTPTQLAARAAEKLKCAFPDELGYCSPLNKKAINHIASILDPLFAAALEEKEGDLREARKALDVEREWVAALTRDNGVLLEAADAAKAGRLCVSQAGRIEHLQNELTSLRADKDHWEKLARSNARAHNDVEDERFRLSQEVQRLKRDGERLDWLEASKRDVLFNSHVPQWVIGDGYFRKGMGTDNLRAALDAAQTKEPTA